MPSPMSLGITSKFYVNTATYGAPTWTIVDLVSDLKIGAKWNEGESSVRRTRVQTMEPTNLALELTGKIRKNISNQAYDVIRSAYLEGTLVDVLVLDGPVTTNTSEGVRFEGCVFDMSEDQGLQAVIFKEFTIKPSAQTDNVPQSVVVTGGSPTYTPFGDN